MDANKLKVLQEINYEIRKTCNNCDFGLFRGTNDFGDCQKFTYQHLKHSAIQNQLSINKNGYCKSHKYRESFSGYIHGFAQLMEK